jgi:uncharacterized protein
MTELAAPREILAGPPRVRLLAHTEDAYDIAIASAREPSGEAAYTGTHVGSDAVIDDMLGSAMAATGGSFRLDLEQTVRHGPLVTGHVRWSATRDGRAMSGREVAVYRVEDGQVVEACFHLDDPDATDAFFR